MYVTGESTSIIILIISSICCIHRRKLKVVKKWIQSAYTKGTW
jgi:hypothetical protein